MMKKACDVVSTAAPILAVALFGHLVRYMQHHRGKRFEWKEFLSGYIATLFAVWITYNICMHYSLDKYLLIAFVSLAAYGGITVVNIFWDICIRTASDYTRRRI